MSSKEDVLIVEDSPAIGMLLKSYLEKLGYSGIHICETGSRAINTFIDLINQDKQPIVLLDYMLPDMDARSVLTQMLEVQPNARVILETATEKEDEGVKELIRLGIYHYLEKPIRFESLKNIIEIIEREQSFFTKESEQVALLKQSEIKAEEKIREDIDFILKSANQISLNKIIALLGFTDNVITSHLQKLETAKKIVKLEDKKEIACNQCESVKITEIFYCPSCKSSDFRISKLIEHYGCGNVAEVKKYENDICPKCRKRIKLLGVDHRILENYVICNSCKNVFSEISSHYFCLKCESKFKIEEAKWKTSTYFKALNL